MITVSLPLSRPDLAPADDLAALYAGIQAEPAELTRYGVIADLLEERGYRGLPHAYRWLMHRGKWPHLRTHYARYSRGVTDAILGRKVPQKFRWAWYSVASARNRLAGVYPYSDPDRHELPALVLPGEQQVYPSHAAAVQALAKWLQGLKNDYDLVPEQKGL